MLSLVLSTAMLFSSQQEEPEALKRRLLAEVERKLQEEEERILKEIEKLIDEELKKGATPAPTVRPSPKPTPSVQPSPSTAPRKGGRGFLGVRTGPLEGQLLADVKKRGFGGGILLMKVVEDSPAEKAGLAEDDIIVAIGEDLLIDHAMLPKLVQSKQAGDTIAVRILRGPKLEERTVNVVLAPLPAQFATPTPLPSETPEPKPPTYTDEELRERIRKFLEGQGGSPSPEPSPRASDAPSSRPWLGVTPDDIGDDVRSQLKLDAGVGVAITSVTDGSPAAKGGLKAGDVLVKIDGQPVKGEEGLAKFMTSAKADQKVKLTVIRAGAETELSITLVKR